MTTSGTDDLLAILQRFFNPREEGWLWLATYVDGRDGGVVNQIEGAYDDAAESARGLARVINDRRIDRAYVALCRGEGRPTEADRELWRELRRLVSAESLVDMVVFNRREAWSMRAEDAASRVVSST
jgi:hypothetical protein